MKKNLLCTLLGHVWVEKTVRMETTDHLVRVCKRCAAWRHLLSMKAPE